MFRVVDYPDENLLTFHFEGALTKADYDWMIPVWEAKMARWGKLSMYGEIGPVDHITPAGIWEHVAFDVKHWNDFDRVAFVCDDKKLIEALVAVAPKISQTQMRHYPWSQQAEALRWVRHREAEAVPDTPRTAVLREA